MAEASEYGGLTIARALAAENVEAMFGILGAMDLVCEEGEGLGIKHYVMRHEQAGGYAADGYARAARRPGVAYSSMGPGLANVAPGICHAAGASSPVVLLAGTQPPIEEGMYASQEGSAVAMLKDVCKWTHRIVEPATMGHWIRKAFRDCIQPNPGPVVLDFSLKLMNLRGTEVQLKYVRDPARVAVVPPTAGDPDAVLRVVETLLRAQRPVLLAGDGVYWSDAAAELREFAELLQIPVCTRRLARGAVPESHPYAFTAAYRRGFLNDADTICLIGHTVTGIDEWFEAPDWNHAATWIQIQDVPGNVWYGLPTDHVVIGSSRLVLRQMIADAKALLASGARVDRAPWLDRLATTHAAIEQRQRAAVDKVRGNRPIHPQLLCAEIAGFLDPSSTLIYDSFATSADITSQVRAAYAGQIIDAGLFQTLGHSIGMAIGAQVARPGRQVVALIGDGGFGISGMDMETMARYGLPAIVVLYNNSSWGGGAWAHDLYYPQRNSGAMTKDVRYDDMFRAVGCHTEFVTEAAQIRPALDRAFSSGKPALLNVIGEQQSVHPYRMRCNVVDTWSRDNFDALPLAAQEEMRALPRSEFERASKRTRDNLFGTAVPVEELMRMVGRSAED
jgi:acetolactate synthase-1/2/3 large subunit